MKLKSLESLKQEAVVVPTGSMTRREKLDRWVELLEARGAARLSTLWGIEYAPKAERLPQRHDDSPISVAFADPVLRNAGLTSDTYGAALAFFELDEGKLHRLTCRCQFGSYVAAQRVASRLRGMMSSPLARTSDAIGRMISAARARFA